MGKHGRDKLDVAPVERYMDELVQQLCALVPRAIKLADEEAIHDARVTTRRLTAAVRLLRPAVSREYRRPFAKALRSLRRRLGPLRDLDVMIGHLQPMAAQGKHAEAARWVSDQLQRERTLARREAVVKTPPVQILARLGSWLALREEVKVAESTLLHLLTGSIAEQLAAFSSQAVALSLPVAKKSLQPADAPAAVAGLSALAGARSPATSVAAGQQDPHELRITGKLLRYSLELAGVAGKPLAPAFMKRFKQMQESLGLWHDYVVLSEKTLRVALEIDLGAHRPALYEQVLDLARFLWQRARRDLTQFSTLWARNGPSITEAICGTFSAQAIATSIDGNAAAAPISIRVEEVLPSPRMLPATQRSADSMLR